MAANDINLKINLDDYGSASTIGELKKQLKELKSAALEAGEGSEAFNQISQKAGELNDKITRVNENIRANTGSAAENATRGLANIASVGVGAFSAVQGAMAMFGVESEDLQKTLVTLNGAMALTQGLKSLAEAPDLIRDSLRAMGLLTGATKANAAATAAGAVATEGAAVAQGEFAIATIGSAGAMNILKTAIITTGIGALVVALGYAVSAMMELASQNKETEKSQNDYNTALTLTNNLLDTQTAKLDARSATNKANIDLLKSQGKSLEEIHKLEYEGLKLEYDKSQAIYDNLVAQKKANADRQNNIMKNGEAEKGELVKLQGEYAKLENSIKKQYTEVGNFAIKRDTLINNQKKEIEERDKKIAEENAKKQDERNKKAAEIAKRHAEDLKNIRDKYIASDRDRIAKQFDDDIAKLDKNNKSELELINKVEEAKLKALSEYDDKLASKRLQDSSNLTIALAKDDQSRIDAQRKMVDDTIALNETVSKSGKKVYEELGMSADEWALKKLELQKKVDDDQKKLDAENLKRKNDDLIALDDINVIAIEREGKKLEALNLLNEDFFKREQDVLLKSLTTKRDIELQQKDLTEAQIKLINEKYLKDKEDLEKATSDKISENNKKNLEKETKDRQDNFNKITELTQTTFSALSGLSDLFFQGELDKVKKGSKEEEKIKRKAFAVNKALQVSTAIISGIQSVQSALATPPGPPATIPFAIAAGAMSAINVAKILATKFDSTNAGGMSPSGDGGGGVDVTSQQPATFTAPQFFGLGNGTNPNGGNQPSPLQVYVLENDITNAQNNVLGYIQTSVLTLGPQNNGPLGPQ